MKRISFLIFLLAGFIVPVYGFPPEDIAILTWTKYYGSLFGTGIAGWSGEITSWNLRWSTSGFDGEGTALVADVDQDGYMDVIFVEWSACRITSYRGINGSVQWSVDYSTSSSPTNGTAASAVIADILPTEPGLEIALQCGDPNALLLLRGTNGSEIWRINGLGGNAGPTVAIQGSDTLILVVTFNYDSLVAVRPDGSIAWKSWGVGVASDEKVGSPVVGDIDGDGSYEVVSKNQWCVWGNCFESVGAYDFSTGVLEWYDTLVYMVSGGSVYLSRTPVTLADLTGDGIPEVITAVEDTGSVGGKVVVLDGFGNTLWTDAVGAKFFPVGQITAADINKDGYNEIVVGFNYESSAQNSSCLSDTAFSILRVYSNTGVVLWEDTLVKLSGMQGGGRIIGDFDNDCNLEIAVQLYGSWCGGTGDFIIYDGATGIIEWSQSGIDGEGLSAGDVDGDNCTEIVLTASLNGGIGIGVLDGDIPSISCRISTPDTCGPLGNDDELGIKDVSFKSKTLQNGKIYDISGREVLPPLKKGVYILKRENRLEKFIIR